MEGDTYTLILVWVAVLTSLWYVHTVSKVFPKGLFKQLSIFPIICLFFVLPLKLTTVCYGGVTTFLISWLANFKLILFAFDKGPLHSNPPIPLISKFIPLACFPVQTEENHHQSPSSKSTNNNNNIEKKKTLKSPLNYLSKIMLMPVLIRLYELKDHIHPKIILFCHCIHIYVMLEIMLALFASLAKGLVKLEIEPEFEEPYLATSLQDFWGRRWNLIVTRIMHPTVYEPVKSKLVGLTGRKLATSIAVLATFLVSGLMHELVVYNVGKLWPTGEMTCFFLLHGVSLSLEIAIKKTLRRRSFRLPKIASIVLTLGYVILTSFWLFFPPFLRAKFDVKGCTEILALVEFVKNRRLVDPKDISCPFL